MATDNCTGKLAVSKFGRHRQANYWQACDEGPGLRVGLKDISPLVESYRKVGSMAPVYLIDIFGWLGSVAVIAAYALISSNKVGSRSRLYQVLNLFGSICLVVNTAYYHAFPSTVVNLVWLAIAAFTLVRIGRSANREPTQA